MVHRGLRTERGAIKLREPTDEGVALADRIGGRVGLHANYARTASIQSGVSIATLTRQIIAPPFARRDTVPAAVTRSFCAAAVSIVARWRSVIFGVK
jgi:hypothetical protein